jgi:tRNA threonylcarbamoyladenosine biosynthesis protein TsaB
MPDPLVNPSNSILTRALAIETSSRVGSVALVENGQVLAEETFPHGLQHAARIIPAIDELCQRLAWKSRDLTELYVSAGPGSFTGLRIGITLAKTLAFTTAAKIVAVPSVRVLVENAPSEARHVIIVIDAKRDQIFTARFERSNETEPWMLRVPAHLGTLSEMLDSAPRPVHLLGEGMPWHGKFIPPDDSRIIIVDEALWRPRAGEVAALGWKMARENQFTPAMELLPIYIRRPEAEEKFDAARAALRPGQSHVPH